jgi:hypothetical protein
MTASRSSSLQRNAIPSTKGCTDVSRCIRPVTFTGWTLGFKPCSLHPAIRVWTGLPISGFSASSLSEQAAFPLDYRRDEL